MEIYLNGEKKEVPDRHSLGELLSRLGIEPDSVVVEHNELIVPRPQLNEKTISKGDVIEIVRFVGGG